MLAEILLLLSNKKSQSLVCFVILFMTSTQMTRLTPLGILKCCNIRHKKQLTGKLVLPLLLWGLWTTIVIRGSDFFLLTVKNNHNPRLCIFHISFPHALCHLILTIRQPMSFLGQNPHGNSKSNSLAQVTRNTILYVLPLLSITLSQI